MEHTAKQDKTELNNVQC